MASHDPEYRYPRFSTDTPNPGIDTPFAPRNPEWFSSTDTHWEYRYPLHGFETMLEGFETFITLWAPTASFGFRYSTSSIDTLGPKIADLAVELLQRLQNIPNGHQRLETQWGA
ncbi:hypothetical protein V6N13_140231 [Hibiscus sabdariffa]